MSTNLRERPVAPEIDQSLTGGQLNKWIPLATLVVCVVVMTALIAMFNPDTKCSGCWLVESSPAAWWRWS